MITGDDLAMLTVALTDRLDAGAAACVAWAIAEIAATDAALRTAEVGSAWPEYPELDNFIASLHSRLAGSFHRGFEYSPKLTVQILAAPSNFAHKVIFTYVPAGPVPEAVTAHAAHLTGLRARLAAVRNLLPVFNSLKNRAWAYSNTRAAFYSVLYAFPHLAQQDLLWAVAAEVLRGVVDNAPVDYNLSEYLMANDQPSRTALFTRDTERIAVKIAYEKTIKNAPTTAPVAEVFDVASGRGAY